MSQALSAAGLVRGHAAVLIALLLSCVAVFPALGQELDLVLAGGRVMDPASGLDAIRHVGEIERLVGLLERGLDVTTEA
ncbi:MAG TPA: hypothetical protein VMT85_00720 [Thermoanaerobaculia bacterium]|nr:hypothetical protein [Thermoanaerobaculia bacterium]